MAKKEQPETQDVVKLAREYIEKGAQAVNEALDRFLPSVNTTPTALHSAMRYSLFAGGKRIRPVLCLAAAECCGGSWEQAMPLACALECIHTYSLIHDDLPAMDNDDFRRGRPTCHKVYGEAMAILAGDALLTIAFEIAAQAPPSSRHGVKDYVLELARAAGSREMVGGQALDLQAEGQRISLQRLRNLHLRKTSALLACSVRLGAMSAGASKQDLAALTTFGRNIGLAFQIIDDILDVTVSSERLGKTAGKDIAAAKATYPALMGLERSRQEARQLTHEALEALQRFGKRAAVLEGIGRFLLDRDY